MASAMKPLPVTHIIPLLLVTSLVACQNPQGSPITPTTTHPTNPLQPTTCIPTIDDGVSPSYKPDAPTHSSVGKGHVLTGVVLSSADCSPIPHAKLELWPEYAGLGHPDEARVTLYTDSDGTYRFESDPPEHIHMRISALGFVSIGQNSYHANGNSQGTFDIVLKPES